MTFVSVAQAARRLGIDAKTVRSFLAEAHLPLQDHPCDGRKTGVSGEHLDVLARWHQRSLASSPQDPPAPGENLGPALPDALLALPQRLSALQAQVTALQQQVRELTRLLQPHAQPPDGLRAGRAEVRTLVRQTRAPKRSPKPAPPPSHSRSAASAVAQPPRKPVHVIPRVEYASQGR
jgi:hypothetical protein